MHERASMLRYTYIVCLIVTEKECVLCEVRADAEERVRHPA